MIKIAIVEDHQEEAERLKKFITRYSSTKNILFDITIYKDAESFLFAYQNKVDIIFMDIELPGDNGLDACRKIREYDKNVSIVFVTNMAQYAINGYEVDALDFILKPIVYEDFVLKMEKVMRYANAMADKNIVIKHKDGMIRCHDSEIYYVEVIKHYLVYYTIDGQYVARGSMKTAEMELPNTFVRCANSYLVNMRHIKEVNGNTIVMDYEDAEITITRSRRNAFLEKFSAYIGGLS